jgi:hypothetical protein
VRHKLVSLVCEDEQVKTYFGFPPTSIKTIAESTSTTTNFDNNRLFVLDDLQIEIKDDLEMLQQKLIESGGTGWVILIAMRSNHIANNISGARFARA